MPTTTTWRERLDEDLRLHDFRPKTREAYSLVARLFADRLGKDPVLATEDDVRAHLLHLREEKKLAPSTINLAVCGLRFFFVESPLGLRLGEGLGLETGDIDGGRLFVWVRDGKGARPSSATSRCAPPRSTCTSRRPAPSTCRRPSTG